MSNVSHLETNPSFTRFSHLPPELRLKIWGHVHEATPPQLIPFYLCKSDLDYLRLKRKACHDCPHVFAGKMRRVPAILHVCREARSVGLLYYSIGFDISRLLSLGRGETDIDTYTTCSHEVSMDEQERGIYWDKAKDVVFLDSAEWLESEVAAYVWGGKTGVKFGKMRRVAMTYETVISCGIGEYLGWESIDLLLVLMPEYLSREDLNATWVWKNRRTNAEGYIQMMLGSRGLFASEGDGVEVKFDFRSIEELMGYVTARGI